MFASYYALVGILSLILIMLTLIIFLFASLKVILRILGLLLFLLSYMEKNWKLALVHVLQPKTNHPNYFCSPIPPLLACDVLGSVTIFKLYYIPGYYFK